jgi:thiosulfate reductase/polysulfide reductase chain A
VLIDEGLYAKDFVQSRTHGFEKLKEHVRRILRRWAEKETEIPAQAIENMAREMAESGPRGHGLSGQAQFGL